MLKLADLAAREDFSLGKLLVSPSLRSIKGPAGEIHVEPLTMQVFLLLADAQGQVVTRNRLFDECWGGVDVGDHSLNRTITMVRRIAAETAPGAFRIESIPRTGYRLLFGEPKANGVASSHGRLTSKRGVAVALSAIVLLAGAWLLSDRPSRGPSVAIASSDPSSGQLARRIAGAAMSIAAASKVPIRLVDGGYGRPDFLLKVGQSGPASDRRVELELTARADQSLVWSWSAREPVETASQEAEARDVAARVLTCAAETRRVTTNNETIKLYLDACARFEPWTGTELMLLADSFRTVTERAPRLPGAWSKLFLAKAEAIEGFPPIELVDSLRDDLRIAHAAGVEVPETFIAKAAILPLNARFDRLQLYEAGLALHPSNPALLSARSWQLRSVGRMDEAARTAQRLATLYPQSSAASTEYANSMMHSGRVAEARAVLEQAGKVTPGASNIRSAMWRLDLRYGDPAKALKTARSGNAVLDRSTVAFLEARINPTAANIDRAITELESSYRADPREPGGLAQALGAFGRDEEAIQLLLRFDGSRSGDGAEMLFRPSLSRVRRDPRFMQIARNFGVTDYWIKSGVLPDFCFEPNLPYVCRQELAKMRA